MLLAALRVRCATGRAVDVSLLDVLTRSWTDFDQRARLLRMSAQTLFATDDVDLIVALIETIGLRALQEMVGRRSDRRSCLLMLACLYDHGDRLQAPDDHVTVLGMNLRPYAVRTVVAQQGARFLIQSEQALGLDWRSSRFYQRWRESISDDPIDVVHVLLRLPERPRTCPQWRLCRDLITDLARERPLVAVQIVCQCGYRRDVAADLLDVILGVLFPTRPRPPSCDPFTHTAALWAASGGTSATQYGAALATLLTRFPFDETPIVRYDRFRLIMDWFPERLTPSILRSMRDSVYGLVMDGSPLGRSDVIAILARFVRFADRIDAQHCTISSHAVDALSAPEFEASVVLLHGIVTRLLELCGRYAGGTRTDVHSLSVTG